MFRSFLGPVTAEISVLSRPGEEEEHLSLPVALLRQQVLDVLVVEHVVDGVVVAELLLQALHLDRVGREELLQVGHAVVVDVGLNTERNAELVHEGIDQEVVAEAAERLREEDGGFVGFDAGEGDAAGMSDADLVVAAGQQREE